MLRTFIRHRFISPSVFTILLLALVLIFFKPFSNIKNIESLEHISASAGRMMERHLNLYNDYENVTIYEKAIHDFLFGQKEHVLNTIIDAYDEVLTHFGPEQDESSQWTTLNIHTRKLITIAEFSEPSILLNELEKFDNNPEEEIIAETIRFAYIDSVTLQEAPAISAAIDLFPSGWAKDHLIYRISRKTGNTELTKLYLKKIQDTGKQHRNNVLILVAITAAFTLIGLILMITKATFYKNSPWPSSILQTPWQWQKGYLVAVKSAVYGLTITFLLFMLAHKYPLLNYLAIISTLFASIPMLYLIQKNLLAPLKQTFFSAFGMSISLKTLPSFLSISFSLLSLQLIGSILIGWGSWKLGMTNHWSSSFHEHLVFSSDVKVILSTFSIIILIPIFEEIGFRGLVYTSLRQRFTPIVAIVVSSLIFSTMHIASLPNFLSIFWSGLILAYAYERYNSLLPGMFIHSISNLLNISVVLLFYR